MFLSLIAGSVLTVVFPLIHPATILVLLFSLDIAAGIIFDKVKGGGGFSSSKFYKSLRFLCMYIAIIAAMYTIFHLQGDVKEGLLLLKAVTYVCIYFYFSNIAKNMHNSYPENRFFAFLYFVLSVDIIFTGKIPVLQRFLEKEKELKENQ